MDWAIICNKQDDPIPLEAPLEELQGSEAQSLLPSEYNVHMVEVEQVNPGPFL